MTEMEKAHPHAADILAHMEAVIGTPFQLQGRLVGVGLDCVGVVCEAARAARISLDVPADYSVTGPQGRDLESPLALFGFRRRTGMALPADVVVMQGPGGRQHLGVWTGLAIVHAHMGLRQVISAPLHPDWPVLSSWCLPQG